MPTRKPYIEWQPYDGQKLVTGRQYLVCGCYEPDKTCTPEICTFYDKGDVIDIPARKDFFYTPEEQAAMTKEQRLLTAIFGTDRSYVIPARGFYRMTADYGVDENYANGSFAGCEMEPTPIITDTDFFPVEKFFWSELPLSPDGYTYGKKNTDIPNAAEHDAVSALDADPVAAKVFSACKDGTVTCGPCTYAPSKTRLAETILAVTGFAREAAALGDDKEIEKTLTGLLKKDKDGTAVRKWFKDRSLPDPAIKAAAAWLHGDPDTDDPGTDFYAARDNLIAKGGPDAWNVPYVLQRAYARTHLPWEIRRLTTLTRLKAPEVILADCARHAAGLLIAQSDSRRAGLCSVDAEKFADLYGVNPDGSRSGRACKIGDAELIALGLSDEEKAQVAGINGSERYIWAYAPNFLMRKKGGPILDTKENGYLRDENGEIVLYETCPKEKLDELNKE